jgi:phage terminase small subunit
MTPKQTTFTIEYLKDLNATAAATRAGYAHPNVQGSQLLSNQTVRIAVQQELNARADRLRIDADWVIAQLEREAMDYQNSGSTRVRALELLGKHLGAFAPNRLEVTYSSGFFADI